MSNLEPEERVSEVISAEEISVTTSNGESQQEYNTQDASTEQIHQQTRSGDIVSPVGDNARITINHYYRIVRYVEKRAARRNDDEEATIDTDGSTEDDSIAENLLFGQQNLSRFDDIPSKAKPHPENLPLEEEKLSDWYYELDEYEQCYVQVVAILHGAAAREIYQKADTFYRLIQEQKHTLLQPGAPQQEASVEMISREDQTFAFPRKPRLKLQEHTYTITRRVKGTESIFWQDVNSLGQSPFASYVLSFLAKEFVSKGEHWEHFLAKIEDWSSKRGGSSWRAARALGVILWYQDLSQFQKKAEVWAKKRTKNGQELAASLLDAAREVELLTLPEHAQHTRNSPVLELLREWTGEVQDNPIQANISLGCATAKAYSLVGKNASDTDIALQGVNDLLKFRQKKEVNDVRLLFGAVVSTYVNLTWSGYLRVVLRHLAETAEELVHRWALPAPLEERYQHRAQREMRLKAILKAFFLVAAATSSEEQRFSSDDYTQPLEIQITIPDPSGRNVFLSAILLGDAMATSICTVLCSAIVTINNEQESKIAFELIRRWADMIPAIQQSSQIVPNPLYEAFVQFLVKLGRSIERWCRDLGERGYRVPGAGDAYQHKLEQWRDEGAAYKRAVEALARDVLVQLRVNSVS